MAVSLSSLGQEPGGNNWLFSGNQPTLTRLLRTVVASLGLAGVLALSRPVAADDSSEAALHYKLGEKAYEAARATKDRERQKEFLAEAIEHFTASHRLVPNPKVAEGIGASFAAMEQYFEAFNWYTTALDFQLEPEQKKRIDDAREILLQKVAVVDVVTDPAGATLFIERETLGSKGRSPRAIATSDGPHKIIARLPEYHDAVADVEAKLGTTVPLRLELKPVVGRLVVSTATPGALVYALPERRVLGRTPLHIELPVGSLKIAVSRKGFVEHEQEVVIEPGRPSKLVVTLKPLPSLVARLVVSTDKPGADVNVEGRPVLGSWPRVLDELNPGDRLVTVSARGLDDWHQRVPLEPGATTRVDVHLADPKNRPWPGWIWLGSALSGALLGSGAIVGISALNAKADLDREPTSEGLAVVNNRNTLADTLFLSGAAVGTATLLWLWLRPSPDRSSATVTVDR